MLMVMLVSLHLGTTNREFSEDNINWNGTSDFFSKPSRYTTLEISHLTELKEKKNATLLIIAPHKEYLDTEVTLIRDFIEEGNTLFLADDLGTGKELLKKLQSNISIRSGVVASLDRLYNDSSVIVTSPVHTHPLTQSVSTLIVDRAVSLSGGEPLIQSGIISWIDTNNDGRVSGKELLGRYTVLSRDILGDGEIIVLSDPSQFINAMTELEKNTGNNQFLQNIIHYQPLLIIDMIHTKVGDTSLVRQAVKATRQDQFLKSILILIVLLAIGTGFIMLSTKRKRNQE